MKTVTLIRRNLSFYRRTNAAVVGGVCAAVAVLAGALVVGDSVRASLRGLFLQRLGRADTVVSADNFFREALADELLARANGSGLDSACPVIALEGAVTHEASRRRASPVQVYGVDERFWRFHGLEGRVRNPLEREALMSPALARELGAAGGEAILLRVEKPSAIPVESLHGRKEDVGRTLRLTLREVLPAESLGEFSLRAGQSEVRAVFVPLAGLQRDLGARGRENAVLLAGAAAEDEGGAARRASLVASALREAYALEDLGLKVREPEGAHALSLESEGALLGEETARAARTAASGAGLRAAGVYSYLANAIRADGREVPYSLVTALEVDQFNELARGGWSLTDDLGESGEVAPAGPQASGGAPASADGRTPAILLNKWAADDLGARPGDAVELDYYLWREEGRLETRTARFRLTGVLPIEGLAADRNLTPEYPGISGAESLSDWDPPFPVELSRVRPKDEDYWKKFRTTPKAFVPLETGQQLWRTRFGNLTSLRLYAPGGKDGDDARQLEAARADFERRLRAELDPLRAGFAINPARAEGLRAAEGATDFGEYFLYFSFFIVVSGLMLASLFFKLGVEQRAREIGLLQAMGFPARRVRRLFLAEGFVLASLGSLAGAGGAVLYGWLVMAGLRSWWVGAVGTRSLALHVSPLSLAAGCAGGIVAALACVWWTLRALSRTSARGLLAGSLEPTRSGGWRLWKRAKATGAGEAGAEFNGAADVATNALRSVRRARVATSLAAAVACGAAGLSLVALASLKSIGETAGFFGAGALLLVASLCGLSAWMRGGRRRVIQGRGWLAVARLGLRSATHRPGRSVLCAALVASSVFIIVAVEAFRQTGREDASDRKSGAGGYPLYAESLLPVAHDPNAEKGREALNLYARGAADDLARVRFARSRVRPGDDASCLNLFRPREPRVLSAAPEFARENRFSFSDSLAATAEESANPWLLLERDPADGAIPAAADAKSLAYVLHRKLGDVVEIQEGGGIVRLRLVAALSDSLFQGELLVSERNFLRAFPDRQGYRFFLLDTPADSAPRVAAALEEQLADYGFDARPTAERLAEFHRVENTYLSTFQTLGGLGVLLGTAGLAAVLLRNVLERRRELALLRAVGYGRRHFAVMIVAENALLLVAGLFIGASCAAVAVAPALLARARLGHFDATLALLLLAVLMTGLLASLAATAAALRAPLLASLRAE